MGTLFCLGERPPARSAPSARLCFTLPPQLILRAQAGRYAPTIHGARLDVGADGMVEIGGYTLLASDGAPIVIEQARRFLDQLVRDAGRQMAAIAFAAELQWATAPAERYAIALNARVALIHGGAVPAIVC